MRFLVRCGTAFSIRYPHPDTLSMNIVLRAGKRKKKLKLEGGNFWKENARPQAIPGDTQRSFHRFLVLVDASLSPLFRQFNSLVRKSYKINVPACFNLKIQTFHILTFLSRFYCSRCESCSVCTNKNSLKNVWKFSNVFLNIKTAGYFNKAQKLGNLNPQPYTTVTALHSIFEFIK